MIQAISNVVKAHVYMHTARRAADREPWAGRRLQRARGSRHARWWATSITKLHIVQLPPEYEEQHLRATAVARREREQPLSPGKRPLRMDLQPTAYSHYLAAYAVCNCPACRGSPARSLSRGGRASRMPSFPLPRLRCDPDVGACVIM